jgi:hypothetical protein
LVEYKAGELVDRMVVLSALKWAERMVCKKAGEMAVYLVAHWADELAA